MTDANSSIPPTIAPNPVAPGQQFPVPGTAIPNLGTPISDKDADRVRRQMEKTGAHTGTQGGGTIFTEPVLVVNQKAKLIELSAAFSVFDQNANHIAAVSEVGQSALKKFFRLFRGLSALMSHRLEIRDYSGNVVLSVFKPFAWFKPATQVLDGSGRLLGTITPKIKFGKAEFLLNFNGQHVASLKAENFRGWNWAIVDAAGTELGRITKTWEGLGRAMFTNADHYVMQLNPAVTGDFRALIVATSLTIDLVLKQYK